MKMEKIIIRDCLQLPLCVTACPFTGLWCCTRSLLLQEHGQQAIDKSGLSSDSAIADSGLPNESGAWNNASGSQSGSSWTPVNDSRMTGSSSRRDGNLSSGGRVDSGIERNSLTYDEPDSQSSTNCGWDNPSSTNHEWDNPSSTNHGRGENSLTGGHSVNDDRRELPNSRNRDNRRNKSDKQDRKTRSTNYRRGRNRSTEAISVSDVTSDTNNNRLNSIDKRECTWGANHGLSGNTSAKNNPVSDVVRTELSQSTNQNNQGNRSDKEGRQSSTNRGHDRNRSAKVNRLAPGSNNVNENLLPHHNSSDFERMVTFVGSAIGRATPAIVLAKAGFTNTRKDGCVECKPCGLKVDMSCANVDMMSWHASRSRSCEYIKACTERLSATDADSE